MPIRENAIVFRVMWDALRQCLRKQTLPLDWMLSESRGKFHDWFSEKHPISKTKSQRNQVDESMWMQGA